jgi:hypothetical protein
MTFGLRGSASRNSRMARRKDACSAAEAGDKQNSLKWCDEKVDDTASAALRKA